MITGFHQISIIVSSEQSIDFYKRLGFTISNRITREYDSVVLMYGNGIDIAIFIDPNHPKRAENPENLGVRFFSLRVEDINTIIKEFDCSPIMEDWFGKKYCFTFDPDGLPIEFHE